MTHRVSRSAVVPHSVEQMFDLVNDVESYPEFLPGCRAAQVVERREGAIKASIALSRGGLQKTFTTWNELDRPHRITMRLVDGPFKRLDGVWRFEADPRAPDEAPRTRISLDLEFEFASKLVALAIGPVFHQIANSLVGAFERRAAERLTVRSVSRG
ncbi:MAG: type II toxin-antitoxin system RatA family toxin [Thioalkalivibrionaceae bacterium]